MNDVVDLTSPSPPPRPAGQPLREVDGVVLLDSDDEPTLAPRFMSVMRRADDGADARVEARDPMGAPRGVSLMFNERRTPAAERQREWRMDPRAFSD